MSPPPKSQNRHCGKPSMPIWGAPLTAADPELVTGLRGLGYDTVQSANRFERTTADGHQLIIDVLVPSFVTGMRTNQQHGEMMLDEIPGLSLALARLGERLNLAITMMGGDTLTFETTVPDPFSALCVKVLAWADRRAAKDALDVWRMLRVFLARLPDPPEWADRGVQLDTVRVLRADFARLAGSGIRAASPLRAEQAEVRALAMRALQGARPDRWIL